MSLVREIDYGTPRSRAEKAVTLTIDGRSVTVPQGTSVMRAAMEMGTKIPKLCATDMVDAFGSCRLCLVEIEGRAGTPSSCTTPVADGMVVRTHEHRHVRGAGARLELPPQRGPRCGKPAAIGRQRGTRLIAVRREMVQEK